MSRIACRGVSSSSQACRRWGAGIACVGLMLAASAVAAEEPAAPAKPVKNPKRVSQLLTAAKKNAAMNVSNRPYGKLSDGRAVTEFTLTNSEGLVVRLIDYGAIVTAVETPDRNGKLANITLGFDSLAGYEARHPYFGATVGRFCNRIAGGKFSLGGKEYKLAANNGPNHLHGGLVGYDKVMWKGTEVKTDDAVGVKFSYRSADGEEGYPGNVDVAVTYSLTKKNELSVVFQATSDAPTPINLTNHNYWNLAGAGSGKILDHELAIRADQYLPVDDTLIPTGKLAEVAGTPLDFTKSKKIGADLSKLEGDPQGYDHCFALRGQDGKLAEAARVKDLSSGRVMTILTTQPGIQFYTGNFLDGTESNGGFKQYEGFCLETQHYPDSPNQPSFPSAILKPGETFRQTTVHRFSVE